MRFGTQFVNYVCTWDDTLDAINTIQSGRWRLGINSTMLGRWVKESI